MNDLYDEGNRGESAPSMLPGVGAQRPSFANMRHRTEIFMIGGQDSEDEIAAYDALMNRVLAGELSIRSEKESFSNVTGICTTIVKYYVNVEQGDQHA